MKRILLLLLSPLFLPIYSFSQEASVTTKFENFEKMEMLTSVIYQDSKGFIWLGGYSGLYKYDGYQLTRYINEPTDSLSISDNKINSIIEDKDGYLWIGAQYGLNRFDPKTQTFTRFLKDENNPDALQKDAYANFPYVFNNKLWGFSGNWLYYYDFETKKFVHLSPDSSQQFSNDFTKEIYHIYKTIEDDLWFFSEYGLGWIKARTTNVILFNAAADMEDSMGTINHLLENPNGEIWVSTTKGLYLFNANNASFTKINKSDTRYFEMPNSSSQSQYLDSSGNFWLSTLEGVFQKNQKNNSLTHFDQDPLNPNSLRHNIVNTVYEDFSKTLWVGTRTGVNQIIPVKNQFINYITDVSTARMLVRESFEYQSGKLLIWQENDLKILHWKTGITENFPYKPTENLAYWNKGLTNFFQDSKNKLWMGSMNGGGVFVFDPILTDFKHYNFEQLLNVPWANKVNDILEDSKGRIWVCHWYTGVSLLEPKTETFKHFYLADSTFNNQKNDTRIVFEDASQNIWISTRGGLAKFEDSTETFKFHEYDPKNLNSISNNTAFAIYEDKNANLWLPTYGGGLNKFNPNTETFTHFTIKDGLADNSCTSVLPDDKGNLWIGTMNGLSKFNMAEETFRNYDKAAGLINNRFEAFSHSVSPYSGHFFLEGEKGLDIFHPDSIKNNLIPPKMAITNLKINNKEISIALNPEEVNQSESFKLQQHISETEQLELNHHQKVITFEFAALHFAAPSKNKYKYLLEGFDEDWQDIGTNRTATFTNLDAGNYVFKVKGANSSGIWTDNPATIQLTILPPWWQTWWAYLSYFLAILGLAYLFYKFQLDKKLVQQEAKQLQELDAFKSKFFTNITHEFRTPLTVIAGMSHQIKENPDKWLLEGTAMIDRNSQYLLKLINQLLELGKLESETLAINWTRGNINSYLQYLLESFHSFAEGKAISLHFLPNSTEIWMDYDEEKMRSIVSNLLSNALKFTPSGGHIYLQTAQIDHKDGSFLALKVKDTGKGIPTKKLPFIFNRFYQVDSSSTRSGEGTGIGLSLTKELTNLLEGTIEVSSEVGKGTIFTILLPIKNHEQASASNGISEQTSTAYFVPPTPEQLPTQPILKKKAQPTLLIIEDNQDVTTYLKALLAPNYQIESAVNGQEGIEKAIDLVPDIILSDVMMPIKDGIEVCATLKQDERTSHIPIILLTAKADISSKLIGLDTGADAYLAKPFNKEELFIRLKKLIELRHQLQQQHSKILAGTVEKELPPSKEALFIGKVKSLMEANLSDSDFGIAQLCRALGMSRTQLHNKLKALTNRSTSIFIRQIRLQKAKELLKNSDLNVSEVAYEVGFKDPGYFSKVFIEEFGVAPSEVKV